MSGGHPQTDENTRAFWLGVRLRSPFRLESGGYVNFLRRRTLPNDDTGILRQAQDERFSLIMVSLSNHAVTVRRDLYFLANAPCPEGARDP